MSVKPNSPLAGNGGLQKGDLIQGINGQKVSTFADLKRALKAAEGEVLEVLVLRGQSPIKIELKGWGRNFR